MKSVKLLVTILVSFSICADTNGEFCEASSSINCINDTSQVLIASVRSTSNICYLCYGEECLDTENALAEVECESSCYIGIDGKLT
jgi:hypothetical protein